MSAPPQAFYVAAGEDYEATEWTRGPWDPGFQHAGPPAALLAREVERLPSEQPMQLARITYEILRPVPIAPLSVRAEVVRPGRRVEMAEAALEHEGEPVVRARAWRLRVGDESVPPEVTSEGGSGGESPPQLLRPGRTLPSPDECEEADFFPTGHDVGYHTAMEYRFAAGGFTEAGPASVWMRMRQPLIEGEEPSPVQRVLAAADSGNGVSSTLDWARWVFIHVDLTVHLARMPAGEWVGLEAITVAEPSGIGLTDTALVDEGGPIGRAAQTLLVMQRPGQ